MYQIIVIILVLFVFPKIVFDFDYNYYTEPFYNEIVSESLKQEIDYEATNRVLHYTFVLTVFVYMQFFNEVNARKLGTREFNIFKELFNNPFFLGVLAL